MPGDELVEHVTLLAVIPHRPAVAAEQLVRAVAREAHPLFASPSYGVRHGDLWQEGAEV